MWIFGHLLDSPFFRWAREKIEETGARKIMDQNKDREIAHQVLLQAKQSWFNVWLISINI